jgi:ABC-type amino acid transport substrate-binding protein
MHIRLSIVCCIALALSSAGCVPAEDENDRVPKFDPEENIMGEIQREGVLRIGIESEMPPWSSTATGAASGFNVDLGQLVADSLGVDAEFVPAERTELPALVADGDVDIAFPLIPTTEDLLIEHGLTDPYFVAHQRLLVREGAGISEVEDLTSKDVCSLANDETSADLAQLNPGIGEVVATTEVQECLDLIATDRVDAVTGADILLLSIAEQEEGLTIVGDQLSTEGYGAVLSRGTGGFDGFVDGVFAEADKELYWTELYERWVSPVTGEEEAPPFPTMNLEEAAALFPSTG